MKKVIAPVLLLCLLTVTASAAYVPEEVVSENRDGRQLVVKTYVLPPEADPGELIEEPFELEGYTYHYLETIKEEQAFKDTRAQTEVVTVETETNDLADILRQLAPTMEYSKDGFSGTLTLDHTSLQTEAKGYTTKYYTITDTKQFPGLSRNDPSYVPATTVKNGSTLTLSDISWTVTGTGLADDILVPTSYTATATYSTTGSQKVATGYVTTASYTGEVTAAGIRSVVYTVTYPTIKAACEGRQIPAYEAASEFIGQVAGNLDDLLEKASGEKQALNTLERLEQRRDETMEKLQKLMQQFAEAGPEQAQVLEKQVIKAANQAQSQVNQVEAVSRMVRDQMMKNKETISSCIAQAGKAAAQKAESVSAALTAWGYGPDSHDPEHRKADLDLVSRVAQSKTLLEVARHLGRLKELMDGKRRNGYTYGRGEKYSLELGGDVNRAIASEFAMLAAPETVPLFLRKLQRNALKQYQRREPIHKGCGDIICMLDESNSAASQAPWCKAVALALLDIAMRDQRRFAVIHFAGVRHFQTDLFLPGQYTREDVFRCAETFLNGNTDYETPLQEALRLMEQDGFEKADMVFVTDGECILPKSFLERLGREQTMRGFQITGILLDQGATSLEFSLHEFCTNVYRTSQLSREQIAGKLLSDRVA